MAFEGNLSIIPGEVASGDLSADQFKFMVIGASGAALNSSANGVVDGVLQNKPDAAGKAAAVACGGVTKVVSAATIAKGDLVASDASGEAVVAAGSGTFHAGRCVEGGAAGDLISVNLAPAGYLP